MVSIEEAIHKHFEGPLNYNPEKEPRSVVFTVCRSSVRLTSFPEITRSEGLKGIGRFEVQGSLVVFRVYSLWF